MIPNRSLDGIPKESLGITVGDPNGIPGDSQIQRQLQRQRLSTSVETSTPIVQERTTRVGRRLMTEEQWSGRRDAAPLRFRRIGWTLRLVVPALGDCWEWNGSRVTRDGYGVFKAGWTKAAHRFSYAEANGVELTRAIHICHRCDNPPCVNPAHLFAGTRSDNMRDMVSKGRHPYPRKLTDAQVAEIRSRFTSGWWGEKASLGREYGISGNQVAWILNGKRRAL